MENQQPVVYLLSKDLLDSSKTIASARAAGLTVKHFRTPQLLLAALTQRPALMILDLQVSGLNLAEILDPSIRSIGYGSHVDSARLHSARQAGCEIVMPRSQYFEEMPAKITEWVRPKEVQR